MIYKFITDEDIEQQIKGDLLLDILDSNTERKIRKAEATAIRIIKSKSGSWYDIDALLIEIKAWTATNYLTGVYVYHNGLIYIALADNNTEPGISQDWSEKDPRDELLTMYIVDIMLYHLHSSVNPRKVPELRKNRHQEAIDWLDMLASGTENSSFPAIDDNEAILWGSNTKLDHYY